MELKNLCISLVICFIILKSSSFANPTGKSLGCYSKSPNNFNYENFKGVSFETDKLVRVVTLKMKNNKLKVISKLTPYKTNDKNIMFKLKFIWYGNIFFEEFYLNRENLKLTNTSKNIIKNLHCKILENDFMFEMNKYKNNFQTIFDESVGKKKI